MKNIGSYMVSANNTFKSVEKLRKELEAFEALHNERMNKLSKRLSAKYIVERIALSLKKRYGYEKVEVLGPFGLGCQTSIHIYRKKTDDLDKALSITFELSYGYDNHPPTIKYVDYSKNLGRYNKGTIGEVNGGNYPLVNVNGLTIEELNRLILKINKH